VPVLRSLPPPSGGGFVSGLVADADSRIRELERRVAREPGSRFFVPLAEEYRKAGRLPEAIQALESGLAVHDGYVAARIALARAHLEAGRIDDSVAAFSKALAEDPSNLVAAKALGDLHLSRGESLEALKKYLRYRAISGDRRMDALIQRLQAETSGGGESAGRGPALPPPASAASGAIEPATPLTPPAALVDPMAIPPFEFGPRRHTDPHDISGISYKRPSGAVATPPDDLEVPSRDQSLDALASRPMGDEEIITRKIRLPEAMWPFEAAPPPATAPPPEAAAPSPSPSPIPDTTPDSPVGRTLADLYFEQKHYPEAERVYAELLSADPGNDELRRLRDDAARLARDLTPAALPAGDPARERRLERIQILNEWLAVIQTGAARRFDS
jgi:tetratricopeptide (TPR) repeat protein